MVNTISEQQLVDGLPESTTVDLPSHSVSAGRQCDSIILIDSRIRELSQRRRDIRLGFWYAGRACLRSIHSSTSIRDGWASTGRSGQYCTQCYEIRHYSPDF